MTANTKTVAAIIFYIAVIIMTLVIAVRECAPHRDALPETGLTPGEYIMIDKSINLCPQDFDEWVGTVGDLMQPSAPTPQGGRYSKIEV